MIIKVKVKPGTKEEKIIQKNDYLEIFLKERAEGGKANKELIKILAKHFNVSSSAVRIKNPMSREKIVEIA